jgi:hypothetical protein
LRDSSRGGGGRRVKELSFGRLSFFSRSSARSLLTPSINAPRLTLAHTQRLSVPPVVSSMAAYGVPPALGVSPELHEAVSTGVRTPQPSNLFVFSRDLNFCFFWFPTPSSFSPVPLLLPSWLAQTTIMACAYAGGVVLGADSRTSTGNYIANRASDKITMVTDNVWMCRSGSVSSAQPLRVCLGVAHCVARPPLPSCSYSRRTRRSSSEGGGGGGG